MHSNATFQWISLKIVGAFEKPSVLFICLDRCQLQSVQQSPCPEPMFSYLSRRGQWGWILGGILHARWAPFLSCGLWTRCLHVKQATPKPLILDTLVLIVDMCSVHLVFVTSWCLLVLFVAWLLLCCGCCGGFVVVLQMPILPGCSYKMESNCKLHMLKRICGLMSVQSGDWHFCLDGQKHFLGWLLHLGKNKNLTRFCCIFHVKNWQWKCVYQLFECEIQWNQTMCKRFKILCRDHRKND